MLLQHFKFHAPAEINNVHQHYCCEKEIAGFTFRHVKKKTPNTTSPVIVNKI